MGTVSIEGRRGRVELTFRADNTEPIRFPVSHRLAAWMAETLQAEVKKVAPDPLPEKIVRRAAGLGPMPKPVDLDDEEDPFAD